LSEVDKLLSRNRIFVDRLKGVGIISKEDAVAYGFTGPVLRSTGVNYDVRKHQPYLVYDRLDFDVPPGSAEGIARFYNEIMEAPAQAGEGRATVSVGRNQRLFYTETKKPIPEYDNHHIQIYIADFSGPYKKLLERGLITMETDAHEWRFQWIVDPKDGRKLFQIEHEVRSMKHPLFGRPLVNRNPDITNMTYVPGHDAFRGTY
jgi:hypothetical protein